MEGLRTRAAKLAAAADRLNAASRPHAPFRLAFLTDRRGPDPDCVARILPAGSAIVLRHYDDPRRAGLAHRLRSLTRARGVLLLVAGDGVLALAVGADGVHWRADQLPGAPAVAAHGMIVTTACHSAEELRVAACCGAHAAFLSPAFRTGSHPEADGLGPERFAAIAAAAALPVFALGGVDEQSAARLIGRNIAGLGAVTAFGARLTTAS